MNQTPTNLMSVRSDLVREYLVEVILDAAKQRFPGEAPTHFASAMRDALGSVVDLERAAVAPDEAVELAERLARIGYLCREVEVDIFEPARAPSAWLGGLLGERVDDGATPSWAEAAIAVSTELARGEPDERPNPDDGATSWRIPGPGGHVRHYVALAAIEDQCPKDTEGRPRLPDGLRPGELKRCWMLGFLLRCCEENPPPAAPG
jgi:hypothetical protein